MSDAAKTPGYWMYETSGALRPAIAAYLKGDEMTPAEIAAMRVYLRQWIMAACWGEDDDGIKALRAGIDGLTSRQAIHEWLAVALDENIDPL